MQEDNKKPTPLDERFPSTIVYILYFLIAKTVTIELFKEIFASFGYNTNAFPLGFGKMNMRLSGGTI